MKGKHWNIEQGRGLDCWSKDKGLELGLGAGARVRVGSCGMRVRDRS